MPKTLAKRKNPVALHGVAKDKPNVHLVAVALRVLVFNDDGAWFAQGLDIDYAAEGASLADVKSRFENGLRLSIREHLHMFGRVTGLLRPAPKDVWDQFYECTYQLVHSQASIHVVEPWETLGHKTKGAASERVTLPEDCFPFGSIAYMERPASSGARA